MRKFFTQMRMMIIMGVPSVTINNYKQMKFCLESRQNDKDTYHNSKQLFFSSLVHPLIYSCRNHSCKTKVKGGFSHVTID